MFKPLSILTLAGLALALASPGAFAQTRSGTKKPVPVSAASESSGAVGKGDTELNFFGSLSDSELIGTSLLLGLGFGKYVSNNLELKVTQALVFFDATAVSAFIYVPQVSAEFQFRPNPGSPFVAFAGGGVGLSLGYIDTGLGDFFTYSLFLTPVGGFKYFLNERASLTYSLSYQFPLLEQTCGDIDCVDSETTTLQNTLGFSIYY